MNDKWQRVEAAIYGAPVDRVPFAFWRHFPDVDRDPVKLAETTVGLHRVYDMDFVKVMFRNSFGAEDWGSVFGAVNPATGVRDLVQPAVQKPEDWYSLESLSPDKGVLGEQLRVVRLIAEELRGDAPILATLFAPTALAAQVAGPATFLDHVQTAPDAVRAGLQIISETIVNFGLACLENGADGFFYAIQHATREVMRDAAYEAVGRGYDRLTLETLHGKSRIVMLHLHGNDVMFDEVGHYPAHIINWYDRGHGPSLHDAQKRTHIALAGGIDHDRTLRHGTPDEVAAEIHDALVQTDGRHMLLAPGCGLPLGVPDANLRAAREAVTRGL